MFDIFCRCVKVTKLDEEERKTVEYDTQVGFCLNPPRLWRVKCLVLPQDLLYFNILSVVSSPGVHILVLFGLSSVYQWSYFLAGLLTSKEVSWSSSYSVLCRATFFSSTPTIISCHVKLAQTSPGPFPDKLSTWLCLVRTLYIDQ